MPAKLHSTLTVRQLPIILLLFLSFSTTLFSTPVDKLALLTLSLSILLFTRDYTFNLQELTLLSILFFVLVLSYIVSFNNVQTAWNQSFIILYFFTCFIIIFPILKNNFHSIIFLFLNVMFLYLSFGIFSWIYSMVTGEIFFVKQLFGKQMGDVIAAISFATTQQVYASIATLTMIIISFIYKNTHIRSRLFLPLFLISIIAVFLSLNRVWLLFLPFILLYLGGRKSIYAFLFISISGFIILLPFLDVFLVMGTVSSRFMMIEKAFDFYLTQDLKHMIFGSPLYIGEYFYMHGKSFHYIENGPLYILINFGLIGFYTVYTFFIFWIIYVARYSLFLAFYSMYYLLFVQFMTQEFLSISFWLYWVIILTLIFYKRKFESIKGKL